MLLASRGLDNALEQPVGFAGQILLGALALVWKVRRGASLRVVEVSEFLTKRFGFPESLALCYLHR